jgi:hypothetical protein
MSTSVSVRIRREKVKPKKIKIKFKEAQGFGGKNAVREKGSRKYENDRSSSLVQTFTCGNL